MYITPFSRPKKKREKSGKKAGKKTIVRVINEKRE